jgi:hypothetical protein
LARRRIARRKIRRQAGGDGGDNAMTESLNLFAGGILVLMLLNCPDWLEKVVAAQREKSRLDYLLERKDRLFENLRKLNFGYHSGKYMEEDFLAIRALFEREARQLLAEIVDLQRERI